MLPHANQYLLLLGFDFVDLIIDELELFLQGFILHLLPDLLVFLVFDDSVFLVAHLLRLLLQPTQGRQDLIIIHCNIIMLELWNLSTSKISKFYPINSLTVLFPLEIPVVEPVKNQLEFVELKHVLRHAKRHSPWKNHEWRVQWVYCYPKYIFHHLRNQSLEVGGRHLQTRICVDFDQPRSEFMIDDEVKTKQLETVFTLGWVYFAVDRLDHNFGNFFHFAMQIFH